MKREQVKQDVKKATEHLESFIKRATGPDYNTWSSDREGDDYANVGQANCCVDVKDGSVSAHGIDIYLSSWVLERLHRALEELENGA